MAQGRRNFLILDVGHKAGKTGPRCTEDIARSTYLCDWYQRYGRRRHNAKNLHTIPPVNLPALHSARSKTGKQCEMSDVMAAEQGTSLLTPGRHRGLLRAALPIYSLPLLPEAVASSAAHLASLPA